MRHKYKGRKLGTDWSHTKAMKRSLVQQLFLNDRIKTIEARAKEIRPDVDKIITWAKKGDLHSRRLAIAALGNDKELVREIFEKVQQGMFEGRPGGYTRIMKLGPRKGDGAPMVIMELVTETCVPKAERKAAASKATAKKKAAPKKAAKKDEETASESVIEEIKESMEAAEENFAAEVQEAGQEQLAEEKAEAEKAEAKEEAKEAQKAEEVREDEAKAEEAEAEAAKAEGLKAADEEKAK
jgi:large subunit ribosomal protein L17